MKSTVAGGKEVPAYPVTRAELLLLAEHHLREIYSTYFDVFYYGQTCSTHWQRRGYANSRLERIAQLLGAEAVDQAHDAVKERLRQRMGEEEWRVFTTGSEEEKDKVSDEVWQQITECDQVLEDQAAKEKAFAYLRSNPGKIYLDEADNLWFLQWWLGGKRDDRREKLILAAKTPSACCHSFPAYSLDPPPGWDPPYGIRGIPSPRQPRD
jgi:hypothetical protein